jgi:hypothetical protein
VRSAADESGHLPCGLPLLPIKIWELLNKSELLNVEERNFAIPKGTKANSANAQHRLPQSRVDRGTRIQQHHAIHHGNSMPRLSWVRYLLWFPVLGVALSTFLRP